MALKPSLSVDAHHSNCQGTVHISQLRTFLGIQLFQVSWCLFLKTGTVEVQTIDYAIATLMNSNVIKRTALKN